MQQRRSSVAIDWLGSFRLPVLYPVLIRVFQGRIQVDRKYGRPTLMQVLSSWNIWFSSFWFPRFRSSTNRRDHMLFLSLRAWWRTMRTFTRTAGGEKPAWRLVLYWDAQYFRAFSYPIYWFRRFALVDCIQTIQDGNMSWEKTPHVPDVLFVSSSR